MSIHEQALKSANYECFILALSALSLANLVLVVLLPAGEMADIIRTVDVGLSVVFLLDFWYRQANATSKVGYFFRDYGWLDFIGSLPIQMLRVARLYRMIAVSRSLQPVRRRLWLTVLRDRAGTTLFVVLFLVVVLMEVASSLILVIEGPNPGANIKTSSDALWWTWVSVMTVGYGDRYPVTDTGRLVGVVTIAVGVGLYGALTGFLANAFLQPSRRTEQEAREREERFHAELAQLRRDLQAMQPRADTVNRDVEPPTQQDRGATRPFDGPR